MAKCKCGSGGYGAGVRCCSKCLKVEAYVHGKDSEYSVVLYECEPKKLIGKIKKKVHELVGCPAS